MASTSIGSSGVTFPDATTQSTAPVNTSANVNSVSAGTGISVNSTTGAVTVTNTGVTSVTGAGTVSVSASTGGVTITGTGGSGTVTSIATGNGLSGGTITTTGTLTIAAPTNNTVGSYCFGMVQLTYNQTVTFGSNYSAGSGSLQMQNAILVFNSSQNPVNAYPSNSLSGTWKYMAGTYYFGSGGTVYAYCVAVRVS